MCSTADSRGRISCCNDDDDDDDDEEAEVDDDNEEEGGKKKVKEKPPLAVVFHTSAWRGASIVRGSITLNALHWLACKSPNVAFFPEPFMVMFGIAAAVA